MRTTLRGFPLPPWVFASVLGTRLDASNVRKAFDRLLTAVEVDHGGLHQMRHTCASLLLAQNVPITYVARLLGHKDAATTLRIYAHWIPDLSAMKAVNLPRRRGARRHPDGERSAHGRIVSPDGIDPSTRRF